MSHPFELLLKLQDIDARLDEARRRLQEIEDGLPLQRHQQMLQQTTARLDQLQQQLQQQQRLAQREEAEAAELRSERDRLEKRLYGGEIASVKEMEKMEARIAGLAQEADAHELAAIEALEKAQQLEQAVAELVEKKRLAEAALVQRRAEVEDHAAKLRAKIQMLDGRRGAVVGRLPADLLQRYEFHRRRGGVVVAPIQGDRCGICRVSLPVALIARATRRKDLEVCENCGRLLVWMGD